MVSANVNKRVIVGTNVREFFRGLVTAAAANQQLRAADDTLHYLVNLLAAFAHTETLYQQTPDGLTLRPLALLYSDAVDAPSAEERNRALKRLGDVALFISGVFPNSLNRKVVDVDYYIAMGGNAYGCLSMTVRDTYRWRAYSGIFDELATKFIDFVDVLGEVSEQAHLNRDADVMRLYELWVRTGSRYMARRLRRLGIQPAAGSVSRRHH